MPGSLPTGATRGANSTASATDRSSVEGARQLLAAGAILARELVGKSLRVRAMALTYLSLFALVPALVVAFSIVQAFAGVHRVWARVHEFLLENLAVGARATIAPYLDRFVANAHLTSAGLIGGALLIYSAITLFGHVERAINDIWAVRRRRPRVQQLLIYWSGLTLGPILLGASITLGHAATGLISASPAGRLLLRAATIVLTCAFFTVLYGIVPATKVRLRAAVVGGVVAGVAWEIAKGLYTLAVSRFFHYHAIYGSVAAVPIFILWLFVSWTLLLFGARVAFVAQHMRALLRGHPAESTPLGKELLAARVMLEVARAYRTSAAPLDPADIAVRLEALGEPVREVLAALRQNGLLIEVAGGGMVPARPLARITLADVRRVVAGSLPTPGLPAAALVAAIIDRAEELAANALSEVDLESLCVRLDEGRPDERPVAIGGPEELRAEAD